MEVRHDIVPGREIIGPLIVDGWRCYRELEQIVAMPAVEQVLSSAAVDEIGAVPAIDRVIALVQHAIDDGARIGEAHGEPGVTIDGVVTVSTVNYVVPEPTIYSVVP